MPQEIRAKLKEVRQKAGLTQLMLSEKLGVAQSLISMVEGGQSQTTLDVLERWISVCDGILDIRPTQSADPTGKLLAAAARLNDKDRARLQEVAELLPKVDEMSKGSAIAGLRWAAGPEWAAENGR